MDGPRFSFADGYDERKRLYMGLPEPTVAFSALEAKILASLTREASEAASEAYSAGGAGAAGATDAAVDPVAAGAAVRATMTSLAPPYSLRASH